MNTAKVFKSGRSQAIRLPKEFRFKGGEVGINRVGDVVVLFPRNKGWAILAGALDLFTDDFLSERRRSAKPDRRKRL